MEGEAEVAALPQVPHRVAVVARPQLAPQSENAEPQFGERVRILKNLPESPRST